MKKIVFCAWLSFSLTTLPAQKKAIVLPGTYSDCDNVVREDKLAGALNRSPSECEVKFDWRVRKAIHEAVATAIEYLEKQNWAFEKEPQLKTLDGVDRHSEEYFFRLGLTGSGAYEVQLKLNPASPAYAKLYQQYEAAMSDLSSAKAGAMEKLQQVMLDVRAGTITRIYIDINQPGLQSYTFTAGHKTINVPGTTQAMTVAHAMAGSGGDISNSRELTLLFLGPWKSPAIKKESNGGVQLQWQPLLAAKAPHLSVQNIIISLECNATLAREIVQRLDLTKLNSLLYQKK